MQIEDLFSENIGGGFLKGSPHHLMDGSGESSPSSPDSPVDPLTILLTVTTGGTTIITGTATDGNSFITGTLTLYTSGSDSYNNSIDLFVDGGYEQESNSIPLYIISTANENISVYLYTLGSYSLEESIPLYVFGLGHINDGLNLFLEGMIPENINSSINLFIYGATTPTSFLSLPLYTQGTYQTISNSAPLFIQAPSSGFIDVGVNMFLENFPGISNGLPLFLQNSWKEKNNFLFMFIKGAGGYPGAYPISAGMNMFLQQNTVAETYNSNIPLIISGCGVFDESIPLYIIGENKNINVEVPMFTKGVAPISINSGIDLSIPYTSGYCDQFINLYTHGFNSNIGPGV